MSDPILEEVWRVREQLIKEHGGLEGYLVFVEKLDRARRQPKGKNAQKRNMKKTPTKTAPKKTK